MYFRFLSEKYCAQSIHNNKLLEYNAYLEHTAISHNNFVARYVHCSAGSGKLLVTNYTQCLKQSCLGQYRKVNAYNMVGCESFVRCNRIVEYGAVFLFLSSTANQRAKKRFFVLYFFFVFIVSFCVCKLHSHEN